MQLWWRPWSLLTPAEGLVFLCSGGYSRNQATVEEVLSVTFPLFSSWLLRASQSPAGIFHLAVAAGCVDKYTFSRLSKRVCACLPLGWSGLRHVLPPLPRCFLLCFGKVGYGVTFGFVFGRVNKTEGQSQLLNTQSSAVTGKKSLLQMQGSTVDIAHPPGRGYGLCLPPLVQA